MITQKYYKGRPEYRAQDIIKNKFFKRHLKISGHDTHIKSKPHKKSGKKYGPISMFFKKFLHFIKKVFGQKTLDLDEIYQPFTFFKSKKISGNIAEQNSRQRQNDDRPPVHLTEKK